MEVLIAREAGFCYGVKRALSLVGEALDKGKGPIYCLGPLIHNPQVVRELEEKGLKVINDIDQTEGGTLVIRSHGVPPLLLKEAEKRGINILDATCPNVKKVQEYAALLSKEGYQVIIIGERDHPEVKGIQGYAGTDSLIIGHKGEIDREMIGQRIGIVVQTTQLWRNFRAIATRLIRLAREVKLFNTLCPSTAIRYREALRLARQVDSLIVIGGASSANTARLSHLCRQVQPHTYQIESPDDIDPSWVEGKERIGLTAGASTPYWLINAVQREILTRYGLEKKISA